AGGTNADTIDASAFGGDLTVDNLGNGDDVVYGAKGHNVLSRRFQDHGHKKLVGGPGRNDFHVAPSDATQVASTSSHDHPLAFDLATTGVTFDLTQTSGQVQTVAYTDNGSGVVADTVAATGVFPTLVGSSYGDSLVGASNSKVLAGAGDDTMYAPAGGSNLSF